MKITLLTPTPKKTVTSETKKYIKGEVIHNAKKVMRDDTFKNNFCHENLAAKPQNQLARQAGFFFPSFFII